MKWDWKILKQPRRGAERSNPSIVIVTSEALATNLGGLGLERVESDFAKNTQSARLFANVLSIYVIVRTHRNALHLLLMYNLENKSCGLDIAATGVRFRF